MEVDRGFIPRRHTPGGKHSFLDGRDMILLNSDSDFGRISALANLLVRGRPGKNLHGGYLPTPDTYGVSSQRLRRSLS